MAAISEPSPNRQAREVLGTANIAGSGSGVGGGVVSARRRSSCD